MELNETIIVPALIAVVELIKGLGLPKKFSAVVTVLLGAIVGAFYLHTGDIKTGIFKGIIYGLSASGLYSGAKNTIEQVRKTKDDINE